MQLKYKLKGTRLFTKNDTILSFVPKAKNIRCFPCGNGRSPMFQPQKEERFSVRKFKLESPIIQAGSLSLFVPQMADGTGLERDPKQKARIAASL